MTRPVGALTLPELEIILRNTKNYTLWAASKNKNKIYSVQITPETHIVENLLKGVKVPSYPVPDVNFISLFDHHVVGEQEYNDWYLFATKLLAEASVKTTSEALEAV